MSDAAPMADASGANDGQSAAAPKSPAKKQQAAKKNTTAAEKGSAAAAAKKGPADHPKYSEMIRAALTSLKDRGGSAPPALPKYLVNQHVKMARRRRAEDDSLKQSKGSGASGSFRLGAAAAEQAKKKDKKPKTPAATKAKRATAAKK